MSCATHDKLQLQMQLRLQLQLQHRMQRTFNTQPAKFLQFEWQAFFAYHSIANGTQSAPRIYGPLVEIQIRDGLSKTNCKQNTKQLTWLI